MVIYVKRSLEPIEEDISTGRDMPKIKDIDDSDVDRYFLSMMNQELARSASAHRCI
ncbi:hypothetical protein YC2023_016372 [Brassica napus]